MIRLDDYNTEEVKPKFQITRGMVILLALGLIILIVVIIIILNKTKNQKEKFTTQDFLRLESRMVEEAPTYLSQKEIELTNQPIKIDLKELLVENGGAIDSSKLKVVKICKGYVLASKVQVETYDAYISCDGYETKGYISDVTTKKKTEKDDEKPVITIIGDKQITINVNEKYDEQGAKAHDNIDGDITSSIKITGSVDVSKAGVYTIYYTVSDKKGNKAQEKRVVTVIKKTTQKEVEITTKAKQTTAKQSVTKKKTTSKKVSDPPNIILKGESYVTINVGQTWVDPGYSAFDAKGMDITALVNRSGSVNNKVAGTYRITYSVTDSYGNSNYKTRTVVVKSNYIKLVSITLTPNSFALKKGESKKLIVSYSPTNATNKNISWKSSNPSVASVSNGVVKALKPGVATISATASDGVSAKVSVTVK